MRLWSTITKNKCFVKMLQHLLCKCVKATIVAIVPFGIVAAVQNLKNKDKVAYQNNTIDEQCKL